MESLDANNLPITYAYVVFNRVEHKLQCLEKYRKLNKNLPGDFKLGQV